MIKEKQPEHVDSKNQSTVIQVAEVPKTDRNELQETKVMPVTQVPMEVPRHDIRLTLPEPQALLGREYVEIGEQASLARMLHEAQVVQQQHHHEMIAAEPELISPELQTAVIVEAEKLDATVVVATGLLLQASEVVRPIEITYISEPAILNHDSSEEITYDADPVEEVVQLSDEELIMKTSEDDESAAIYLPETQINTPDEPEYDVTLSDVALWEQEISAMFREAAQVYDTEIMTKETTVEGPVDDVLPLSYQEFIAFIEQPVELSVIGDEVQTDQATYKDMEPISELSQPILIIEQIQAQIEAIQPGDNEILTPQAEEAQAIFQLVLSEIAATMTPEFMQEMIEQPEILLQLDERLEAYVERLFTVLELPDDPDTAQVVLRLLRTQLLHISTQSVETDGAYLDPGTHEMKPHLNWYDDTIHTDDEDDRGSIVGRLALQLIAA